MSKVSKKRAQKIDTKNFVKGMAAALKADPAREKPRGTCIQDLAPFKKILNPEDKSMPGRNHGKSALERPGRHSRNLAGPEGSMNSKAKISLTSPQDPGKSFKFQPSPKDRHPTKHFGFGDELMASFAKAKTFKPASTSASSEPSIILHEPFRAEAPDYIKSPPRMENIFNDDSHVAESNKLRDIETKLRKQLTDYSQKATACRREGRLRGEGHAYFCMGVIHDNLKEYTNAVSFYQKYIQICGQINDNIGEALAHNSLGITYYTMAPKAKNPSEIYSRAANHHNKHGELGDPRGKFIAHTNLGIVYSTVGDNEKSVSHHEAALKHAIRLSDVSFQAIAVGHLGLAGCAHKDFQTARACMERHLELVVHLGDQKAKEEAQMHLGYISKMQGDSKAAATYYRQALETAQNSKNAKNVSTAKVQIGIILGKTMLQKHMETVAASFATP
eukprot:CAMPEP_0184492528 /NCGR_PEP_ID=MMETSP0113_2-20130426/23526_1 /TAXON_ID=91329 /ORGANISM="Norrisiella sphaerica, Strain BC52" /LENGTH=445 /DNA_ID=CAMNT_0026877377 /DNA_START=42 /DNA_END=1379 /DNA_ORIENTATION=+